MRGRGGLIICLRKPEVSVERISVCIEILAEYGIQCNQWGRSCGATVLGKLPVSGRPTSLDYIG